MDHSQKHKNVVTRFAPSPTGFMHVGNVRTALFSYLYARKNQGIFILRIEDTDKNREVDGAIAHIMESLKWLGIDWDYGPDKTAPFGACLQSDRLEIYKSYAKKLVARGLAYPDPFNIDEIAKFRDTAQTEGRPFLFREYRPTTLTAWDGTQPLRFKVPEIKRYHWQDAIRGDLSAGEEMLDDFIIIKADGYPTYNFAHIIDDYEMGVTHVIRGEEFISSTPKFLSLYEALEIEKPIFATLPPVMGPDGKKKLSKRDGAKDLLEYRKEGYLPSAFCNFLALIGWNPGDNRELFFSLEDLIDAFSLEKVQRSGGAFDEEKLKWMNREHLNKLDSAKRVEYVRKIQADCLNLTGDNAESRIQLLVETMLERAHGLTEIEQAIAEGEYEWVTKVPEYEPELLRWKKDNQVSAVLPRLIKVTEMLKREDFLSPDTIKAKIWDYIEEVGRGEVLWPLRVAVSGRERSPDPFTITHIIGYEETISRIKQACAKITE